MQIELKIMIWLLICNVLRRMISINLYFDIKRRSKSLIKIICNDKLF